MKNKDNILDYVPIQNCPWEKDAKGRVYLIKEKTRNRLLKRVIALLGRSQDFHIHLDELGTAAWLAVDGRRNILDIADALKREGAGEVTQAEARLAKFFAMLARDKFVIMKSQDSVIVEALQR